MNKEVPKVLPTVLVPVAKLTPATLPAASPPPKPDEREGVHCRKCGCDHCPAVFTVKGRDRLGAFTRRQRRCHHCGHKFSTKERMG
jgi:hypothetical protein